MSHDVIEQRTIEAALTDARSAVVDLDDAYEWLLRMGRDVTGPLATEVWVFDKELARVLLVNHRWRGWVSPGGKVDPGETPREGAVRELWEETGITAELLPAPAAVTVRSYHPDWSATMGVSFAAIVDTATPLLSERGQPARWWRLDEKWEGYFPEDRDRMRRHAQWIANHDASMDETD